MRTTVRRAWPFFAVAALIAGLAVVAPGPMAQIRSPVWAFLTKHRGAPTKTAQPVPFPAQDRPVTRLAVAGDVGTGGRPEKTTAAAMDRAEGDHEFAALLLLGDNVYPDGDPSRLVATVFEPFAGVLDGGTQLIPVLGNHDARTSGGDGEVRAFGVPGHWYARHLDDALVIVLDSNHPDDPDQRAWLEQTLAAAKEPWKIVAEHHPPYSAGQHGSDEAVREAFTPLFERYGVQLVLAGHDHDYQRSRVINGVTYVVSGGAATLRKTGSADFTAASWSTYHFVDLAVWPDRLELRAFDQSDKVFDQATLRR